MALTKDQEEASKTGAKYFKSSKKDCNASQDCYIKDAMQKCNDTYKGNEDLTAFCSHGASIAGETLQKKKRNTKLCNDSCKEALSKDQ